MNNIKDMDYYEEDYAILHDYGIAKIVIDKSTVNSKMPLLYIITNTFGIASQDVIMSISTAAANRIIESNGDKDVLFNEMRIASITMQPLYSREKKTSMKRF